MTKLTIRRFVVAACAVVTAIMLHVSATPVEAASTGCLPASVRSSLAQIRAKFGSARVISSFRSGATVAGTGRPSYHASCRAADFYPPSGKYRAVAAWLKANHSGGVGTYSCGNNHIHIDNGPRVRWHKCTGGGRGRASAKKRYRSASKSYGGYAVVNAAPVVSAPAPSGNFQINHN